MTSSKLAASTLPPLPLLTREGKFWIAVSIALFATGLYKAINLLLLLSYMLVGLWFVNWLLVRRSMNRLTAQREWRTPVMASESTDWRVVLQNDSDDPLRGFQVTEEIGGKPAFWTVDRLSAHGRIYLRETVTFPFRGLHPIGHLRVITRFPFGLVQRAMDLPGGQEVLVLPRMGQVRLDLFKEWLARVNRGEGKTRQRRPLATTRQANLHGLRQFRPGDSPRWIDWKSSARRGELIVREFEDDAPPKLILIVEAWLPETPSEAERDRLEGLLSLAATVCRDWASDHSSNLQLIVLETTITTKRISGGTDNAWPLIDLLGPIRGTVAPARLEFRTLGRARRITDAVLIVSSRPNTGLPAEAAEVFHRPVAALTSPELLDWYTKPAPLC